MPASRCSLCSLDWPQTSHYKVCPQCGEKTDRVSNIDAMDRDEAWSLKMHFDFERFYEKWDAEQPPERLKSEAKPALAAGS